MVDLSLEDFTQLYREQVAPCLEAEGLDLSTRRNQPTSGSVITVCGRSSQPCADTTTGLSGEFWSEDLGLGDDDDGYSWASSDEQTVDALERFLDRRQSRYDLSTSSVDTLRTGLNLYVRAYTEANGTADLLTPIQRDRDAPAYEAFDACYGAFDWLNEGAEHEYSAQTLQRVRRIVDAWYQHLVGRRIASVNPASGLYRIQVEDRGLSNPHCQQIISVS